MARNATNKLLQKAKKSKSDEFYTQLSDIESELKHYKEHFENKVVFCNCDDPRSSNFFNYFAYNFENLGLKKLITTCYKNQEKDLFGQEKSEDAVFLEYTGDKNGNNIPDAEEIGVKLLKGDGDFRSKESIDLLKQADIVVTNPPFSLFREYVEQLVKYEKMFLIIGNINAITYKEIFKLIKENKAWLGINMGRGISGFIVPEHYELYGTETNIDSFGNRIISPNNCLWLTNLDTFKRHEDIVLTKTYYGNENDYPTFDNYDAINVNKTQDIPEDFDGVMGVPITFLHKYNPEQFELIKFRKGNDEKDLSINGKCPYFRILIKNKRIKPKLTGKQKSQLLTAVAVAQLVVSNLITKLSLLVVFN
ncbi:Adenine-specific methyltransferase EcoRI [Flavobacterium psychrophilum DSM 3660]|uniref:adenine-specific methyltransferase EcoRI family protein n=1 Tax=Flavobacterium psychrophilum TaxID=96345 RepID=UPI0004F8E1EA|nr:adenine-specific methyltransferase EcoRI family protein [Flavobacterium psychrophilum]AIN74986.1 adenosine deaminase [Flavobacterium psychrophilum FPG3]MBF2045436.1 adenine-specific methyltransferase EcoRI family protein [Flavobacterium psychrophilum]OXB10009.1 adenosine deaminase [Flavobacterium psychrophilum] [Flavobacterium psychrophilum DSM 3660 = ATCC 49418]SCY30723.1 Adenine-specific methyltransferase EcoRI [Flavobacterium psychrophilum DSM 3660] [Flavobacterium psychrophilum DSM 3660 